MKSPKFMRLKPRLQSYINHYSDGGELDLTIKDILQHAVESY